MCCYLIAVTVSKTNISLNDRCLIQGAVVDGLGHHGLVYSRNASRIARHANVNNIIRHTLVTAGNLTRVDEKGPDGM